jgi:hypothetical protein
MKLQGVTAGLVDATDDRGVLRETDGGDFETVGRLPNPAHGTESLSFRAKTSRRWREPLAALVGRFPAVSLWRLSDRSLLATSGQWLFTSRDGGRTWNARPALPASSGPMGVLPPAVCHDGDEILLGEYPLDDTVPRVRRSTDGGRSWQTVVTLPEVRHVHAVQRDPYSGDLWVTTGDEDHECLIGRLRDDAFVPVGGGSQRWRAVELAFTPDAVLWGTDCPYADRNDLFRLDRERIDEPNPSPDRVGTVTNPVYFSETVRRDDELWVAFSTAIEPERDSTASGESAGGEGAASVVAASSATGFSDWTTLASYRKRSVLADRSALAGRLPRTNAYVFLAADPERGLFLNPYNTDRHDGALVVVPTEQFPDAT